MGRRIGGATAGNSNLTRKEEAVAAAAVRVSPTRVASAGVAVAAPRQHRGWVRDGSQAFSSFSSRGACRGMQTVLIRVGTPSGWAARPVSVRMSVSSVVYRGKQPYPIVGFDDSRLMSWLSEGGEDSLNLARAADYMADGSANQANPRCSPTIGNDSPHPSSTLARFFDPDDAAVTQ